MTNADQLVGATGLKELLRRVAGAPPVYYRSAAGVSTLANLPLTDRAAILRDQLANLPHGGRRFADAGHPVRVGKTGSGDDLLVLLWTAHEIGRAHV